MKACQCKDSYLGQGLAHSQIAKPANTEYSAMFVLNGLNIKRYSVFMPYIP